MHREMDVLVTAAEATHFETEPYLQSQFFHIENNSLYFIPQKRHQLYGEEGPKSLN